ncbi:hypothetical protein [Fulvimarina sp. MAC8]|uniref:hypothetical protein n=1 Tax=Fulvimarina sp. MAC8 TaxID=3162874 RepID=UPI0032EB1924
MRVPFPGSPDYFRGLLAYSSFDQWGWQTFIDDLQSRFEGLQVVIESLPLPAGYLLNSVVAEANSSHGPNCAPAGESLSLFRFDEENPHECRIELECDGADGRLHRLSLFFQPRLRDTHRPPLTALFTRIRGEVEDALRAKDDMFSMSDGAKARLESLWSNLPFGVALMTDRGKLLAMNLEMDETLCHRGSFLPLCGGDFASALGRRSRRHLDDAIECALGTGLGEVRQPASFAVGETRFALRRVNGGADRDTDDQTSLFVLTAQEQRPELLLRV